MKSNGPNRVHPHHFFSNKGYLAKWDLPVGSPQKEGEYPDHLYLSVLFADKNGIDTGAALNSSNASTINSRQKRQPVAV